MKNIIHFAFFILLCIGCAPQPSGPKPTYTIKGRIIDGTTGKVPVNQNLDAVAINWYNTSVDLGTSTTDATGFFTLTYTKTDLSYHPSINITGGDFRIGGITVNKNIDSTFYLSSMGSLQISLSTTNPLGPNDTLFFGITDPNFPYHTDIDTITKTINGVYKTVRSQTPNATIRWGRGEKDFAYNKSNGRFFGVGGHIISGLVTGDPYMSYVTIKY